MELQAAISGQQHMGMPGRQPVHGTLAAQQRQPGRPLAQRSVFVPVLPHPQGGHLGQQPHPVVAHKGLGRGLAGPLRHAQARTALIHHQAHAPAARIAQALDLQALALHFQLQHVAHPGGGPGLGRRWATAGSRPPQQAAQQAALRRRHGST